MAEDRAVPEVEYRFNQEQYDFLKQCSQKGEEGIKEWNKWRDQNPAEDICLDRQDLHGWCLEGVNLKHGTVSYADERGEIEYSGKVYLRKANLQDVNAEHARFSWAYLQGTCWRHADLTLADFHSAHLDNARLGVSQLDGCDFSHACLSGAELMASVIRNAKFTHSDLRACSARGAIVDGETRLWECKVDTDTDFTGVSLDTVIVDPPTKQLLHYNVRRKSWEQWYGLHRILKWLVKPFWWMSDYGASTGRIVGTFFGLAVFFAFVYWLWPRCVIVCGDVGDIRGFLHALYFSVVTMTTLGFGDIAANPDSWQGQVLLMIQVILGYVLLGALVTRFAVLFTAGGPAGQFSKSGDDGPD